MPFVPAIQQPDRMQEPGWYFLFQNRKLLAIQEEIGISIPCLHDPSELSVSLMSQLYIGTLNGTHCFTGVIDSASNLPATISLYDLRSVYGLIDEDLFAVAGRALVVASWDSICKFCAQCGKPLDVNAYERAKLCTSCGISYYPKLSPAIIVAVIKDDRILLARGKNFPIGRYSVIAGYVDPGETLEQCVRREVKEEVGIEIKNISYFGSLPWPCSDSIMIGFTAEYSGGSIQADGVEITEAGWFKADGLPDVPGKVSLARQLIDWFIGRH
jgi:NAD+ diphosphatase